MAANPVKLELTKKTIEERTSKIDSKIMTEIELNDPSIDDDNLKCFLQLLPQNANITSIDIKKHNLTVKSYKSCLELLKKNRTITSFGLAPIFPISALGSEYYAEIQQLVEENRKLSVEKSQVLIATVPLQTQNPQVFTDSIPPQKGTVVEGSNTAVSGYPLVVNCDVGKSEKHLDEQKSTLEKSLLKAQEKLALASAATVQQKKLAHPPHLLISITFASATNPESPSSNRYAAHRTLHSLANFTPKNSGDEPKKPNSPKTAPVTSTR